MSEPSIRVWFTRSRSGERDSIDLVEHEWCEVSITEFHKIKKVNLKPTLPWWFIPCENKLVGVAPKKGTRQLEYGSEFNRRHKKVSRTIGKKSKKCPVKEPHSACVFYVINKDQLLVVMQWNGVGVARPRYRDAMAQKPALPPLHIEDHERYTRREQTFSSDSFSSGSAPAVDARARMEFFSVPLPTASLMHTSLSSTPLSPTSAAAWSVPRELTISTGVLSPMSSAVSAASIAPATSDSMSSSSTVTSAQKRSLSESASTDQIDVPLPLPRSIAPPSPSPSTGPFLHASDSYAVTTLTDRLDALLVCETLSPSIREIFTAIGVMLREMGSLSGNEQRQVAPTVVAELENVSRLLFAARARRSPPPVASSMPALSSASLSAMSATPSAEMTMPELDYSI